MLWILDHLPEKYSFNIHLIIFFKSRVDRYGLLKIWSISIKYNISSGPCEISSIREILYFPIFGKFISRKIFFFVIEIKSTMPVISTYKCIIWASPLVLSISGLWLNDPHTIMNTNNYNEKPFRVMDFKITGGSVFNYDRNYTVSFYKIIYRPMNILKNTFIF